MEFRHRFPPPKTHIIRESIHFALPPPDFQLRQPLFPYPHHPSPHYPWHPEFHFDVAEEYYYYEECPARRYTRPNYFPNEPSFPHSHIHKNSHFNNPHDQHANAWKPPTHPSSPTDFISEPTTPDNHRCRTLPSSPVSTSLFFTPPSPTHKKTTSALQSPPLTPPHSAFRPQSPIRGSAREGRNGRQDFGGFERMDRPNADERYYGGRALGARDFSGPMSMVIGDREVGEEGGGSGGLDGGWWDGGDE